MRTTHRDYAEISGDFKRLCHFVTANNQTVRDYSTWSIGRLVDWKYGLYESKLDYASFCEANAHLWFDMLGELVGFVVCESGDAGFVILTLPGARFLYEEILEWTLLAWRERGPSFYTEITENQDCEVGILERCSFANASTFYTRRFDLTRDLMPRFPLEEGFTIVDMHTHPDYRAQRILRSNAFQGMNDLSEEEMLKHLKFFNHSHNGPIYHAPTDLCVMAADGRLVAGCEALIDTHNAEADIERVCTHSDFRQRGFARAVIQECLYRLKAMGLRNAYIMGYSVAAMALYGSMGAVDEQKAFEYKI